MILDAVIGGADKDYAHFLSGTMMIEILLNAWTYAIADDEADENYIYYSYTCTCRCSKTAFSKEADKPQGVWK